MVYEQGPLDDGTYLGGLEGHIINLAKALIEKGNGVTLLTGAIPNQQREKEIYGIKVVRADFLNFLSQAWNPFSLTFSRQAIFPVPAIQNALTLQKDHDVVHGHIYSAGLAAYVISKMIHTPCVNTIHGSYYDHWKFLTKNPIKAWLYKKGERSLAPLLAKLCAYQIHAETHFAQKVIEWGVPQNKIRIILNGVDTQKFRPNVAPSDELKKFEKPVILTARRLVPKNGVEYFIKAAQIVLKKRKANFIIIGDGWIRPKLEELVFKLGLEKHVKFLGFRPNSQMPNYLVAADIVVVPSIVEASSISLLEAMAVGKPTIASNIYGIRDVAKHLETSYLVQSQNPDAIAKAILHLLEDEPLCKKISENARKYVLERSWQKVAEETLKVYSSSSY